MWWLPLLRAYYRKFQCFLNPWLLARSRIVALSLDLFVPFLNSYLQVLNTLLATITNQPDLFWSSSYFPISFHRDTKGLEYLSNFLSEPSNYPPLSWLFFSVFLFSYISSLTNQDAKFWFVLRLLKPNNSESVACLNQTFCHTMFSKSSTFFAWHFSVTPSSHQGRIIGNLKESWWTFCLV